MTNDLSITESDRESITPPDHLGQSNSIDYWFGRRFLEINIAQELLRASAAEESFASFNVKLDAEMRDFPYAECLTAWQAHGIARGVSISQGPSPSNVGEALTAIGTTVRTGSNSKKDIVLTAIRARCSPAGLCREEDLRNRNPILERERRSQVDRSEVTHQGEQAAAEDGDISRYSMALKELGDLKDELPQYNIRPATAGPEGFTADLAFHGIQAKGSGRTKKIAQHQAAKSACALLQIDPWS